MTRNAMLTHSQKHRLLQDLVKLYGSDYADIWEGLEETLISWGIIPQDPKLYGMYQLGLWYDVPGTDLVIMVCEEDADEYGWRLAHANKRGGDPTEIVARNYGVFGSYEEAVEAARTVVNQWRK